MAEQNIQVALVGGNVHRLANNPSRVMQPGDGLVDLYQFVEIGKLCVATPAIKIMNEWRPP